MTDQKDFLVEELKELRQKVNRAIQDARSLERQSLALASGIWAWLLTHGTTVVSSFGWWIPSLLSFLGGLRALVLYIEVKWLTEYIRESEKDQLGDTGGWEGYVHRRKYQWLRPVAAVFFWLGLFGGTTGGAFWLTCH